MNVTENELLDALREALLPTVGTDDALTGPELQAKLGKSDDVVRRALRVAMAEGRCEVVKVTRVRLDGIPTRVPGYRLK